MPPRQHPSKTEGKTRRRETMNDMNLRQMEVFHAIMRSGSVTGAARQLNVSQPAVSATLRHCEAQLGMKLFERAGNGLRPTPEAHAIFPDIAAIFSRVEAVGRMSRDMMEGRRGNIVVASTFPVAHSYLAQAIAAFVGERPEVHAAVQSLTHPLLIDRVINREVELGITYGPITDAAVETAPLLQSEIACVLREDHPLAALTMIRIADLMPYPLISFAPQMIMRADIDAAFQAAGETPDIRIRVGLSFTAIMLAYAGAGVALTEPMLLETLPIPGLVCRPLQPRIPLDVLLVHAKGLPLSQAMQHFIACLRRIVSLRPDPPAWRGHS
jgi:DNA-binding transcriptional LysR family regulator